MTHSENNVPIGSRFLKIVLSVAFVFIMISIIPGRCLAAAPFNTNVRVDDTGVGASAQYYPEVGLSSSGMVYITWFDTRNGNDDIYFSRSLDGGSSYQTNVRVDDTGIGTYAQNYPVMAVNTSGEIYIAWADRREGRADSDIYFARSINEGVSFDTNIRLDSSGSGVFSQGNADLAVGNDGTIYAAWDDNRNGNWIIWFANSTNEGQSFGTNRPIYNSGTQHLPAIAVSNDGIVYVAWQDSTSGNNDIVLSKSTNKGYTFTTPVRVDDTGSATSAQNEPKIAVGSNGDVYVVWYDNRNGNEDIYFAKSTNQGTTFGTNVRVDDSIVGSQMNPAIAAYGPGNVYITWFDNHNGDYDIYYAMSANGGSSFGTNIQVDDTAFGSSQRWPDIKVDGIGDVYITWHDNRNGNYDIYFSRTIYSTPEFSNLFPIFLIGMIATVVIFIKKIRK